ncbi:MAG: methyltransferase domain-containing protein [Agarilytica sp.]
MSTKIQIEQRITELGDIQPWNHNYALPEGVETSPGKQESHGKNLVKLDRLQPIFDLFGLNGKSVLDVGCNEGFFSLHMGKAGADVLGLDIDEHRITKAKYVQSLIGGESKVRFDNVDIYSDQFKALPRFDLCLCLGFIHRIPDPFTAIASLADRTNVIMFEWKALKFGPHDEPFAYFSPKGVDDKDYYGTEYWLLSYAALESILKRQGFKHFHRIDDPRQRRAILVAGRSEHAIFEQKDVVAHRGRIPALLSHGKRALKTFVGILSGKVNA